MSPRWLHWPAAAAARDWDTHADGIWEITAITFAASTSSATTISSSTTFPDIAKFYRIGGTFSYDGGTHSYKGSCADSSNVTVDLGNNTGGAFNTMSFAIWDGSTWSSNSAAYQDRIYEPAAGFAGSGIGTGLNVGQIVVFQTQHVTDVSGWSAYS